MFVMIIKYFYFSFGPFNLKEKNLYSESIEFKNLKRVNEGVKPVFTQVKDK